MLVGTSSKTSSFMSSCFLGLKIFKPPSFPFLSFTTTLSAIPVLHAGAHCSLSQCYMLVLSASFLACFLFSTPSHLLPDMDNDSDQFLTHTHHVKLNDICSNLCGAQIYTAAYFNSGALNHVPVAELVKAVTKAHAYLVYWFSLTPTLFFILCYRMLIWICFLSTNSLTPSTVLPCAVKFITLLTRSLLCSVWGLGGSGS